MKTEDGEAHVVRLRGLPWSATIEDVEKFFAPAQIVTNGIHFTSSKEGRPSGEAFVELCTSDDFDTALSKHKNNMDHRYVEVFKSRKTEMDWVLQRSGAGEDISHDAVVRLRGLPFGCSKEEISQFFSGLEIVPNGITLSQDAMGRTTGAAFVQFASPDLVEKALEKHKQRIGHRYIEIFKSSVDEIRDLGPMRMRGSMGGPNRMGPYDRERGFGRGRGGGGGGGIPRLMDFDLFGGDRFDQGMSRDFGPRGRRPMGMRGAGDFDGGFSDRSSRSSRGGRMSMGGGGGGGKRGPPGSSYNSRTGYSVHMRGLPFSALEGDIIDFFRPLVPFHIELGETSSGRPSGEADVDFASHDDAVAAMEKDKANMENRYIELFLNSARGGDMSRSGKSMGSGFGARGSGMGGGGMSNDGMRDRGMGGMGNDGMRDRGIGGMSNDGMRDRGMGGMRDRGMGGMSHEGMRDRGMGGMSHEGMRDRGMGGMSYEGMRDRGMGGMSPDGMRDRGMGGMSPDGMRAGGMGSMGGMASMGSSGGMGSMGGGGMNRNLSKNSGFSSSGMGYGGEKSGFGGGSSTGFGTSGTSGQSNFSGGMGSNQGMGGGSSGSGGFQNSYTTSGGSMDQYSFANQQSQGYGGSGQSSYQSQNYSGNDYSGF